MYAESRPCHHSRLFRFYYLGIATSIGSVTGLVCRQVSHTLDRSLNLSKRRSADATDYSSPIVVRQ